MCDLRLDWLKIHHRTNHRVIWATAWIVATDTNRCSTNTLNDTGVGRRDPELRRTSTLTSDLATLDSRVVIVHDLSCRRFCRIFLFPLISFTTCSGENGATVYSRGGNARSKGGWNEDRILKHQRRAEETGSSDEGWVLGYHRGIGGVDRADYREQGGEEGGQVVHQSRVEKSRGERRKEEHLERRIRRKSTPQLDECLK